jgi:hypothetical protein
MKIVFTDIHGAEKGTVTYENGELTGSPEGYQAMVDDWIEEGRSEREFLDKYSNWTNGYSWSELKSK